jgi:hypothetical protein
MRLKTQQILWKMTIISGNAVLTSKFSRHTTMTYLHAEKNELYESIERANDEGLIKKVKELQDGIK